MDHGSIISKRYYKAFDSIHPAQKEIRFHVNCNQFGVFVRSAELLGTGLLCGLRLHSSQSKVKDKAKGSVSVANIIETPLSLSHQGQALNTS